MHHRYRACPLCEAVCGLEFRFEGDRLAAIHGDKADALSRGHICPKGNAILDLESDPDRLRRPVRRVGGEWVEADWDEAFRAIGARLHELQTQHGQSAVAVYLGNPTAHHLSLSGYVGQFLRAIGSRNLFSASSVDQWPHQLVCWQMYGHQWLLPIPDLDHLDTLLMLGANPIASNGSLMTAPDVAKRLEAIRKRGALIVVDPRRSETAAVATEHHAIRPGTDVLFLRALLQAWRRIGPPRLEAYAGKIAGFDEAMAHVDGAVTSKDALDEQLEARTGISSGAVESIAARLYAAENAAVYGRMGVSTQSHGTVTQYLIQLCNLYLGQLDRAGGCLPNEPAVPITGPGTAKGSRGRWHSRVRGLPEVSGELPVSVLREEIETEGDGRIRALVTIAGNPVLSTPNGAALDRAIDKKSGLVEFQIAIDPYVNETTRHADWILPPPSFLGEDHYDVYFNGFAIRRFARLNTPIVAPPAGSLPQWSILEGVVRELRAARGEAHRDFLEPREIIQRGLERGTSGLTIDDLLAAPHGIDLGPLAPSLLRRLETESGRIECAPGLLIDLLDAALAELPGAALGQSAKDAGSRGKLALIGRRNVLNNNSWMHNAPRLVKGKPRHQLWMHPTDLATRGLADGDTVRVRSRTGEVTVAVAANAGMMPGVVSLPHGYGHQLPDVRMARAGAVDGASINDLTDDTRLDHGTGNAAFSGTPVEVEALG